MRMEVFRARASAGSGSVVLVQVSQMETVDQAVIKQIIFSMYHQSITPIKSEVCKVCKNTVDATVRITIAETEIHSNHFKKHSHMFIIQRASSIYCAHRKKVNHSNIIIDAIQIVRKLIHIAGGDKHISATRPMEPINTKMLLAITTDINAKAVQRQVALRGWSNNKTSNEVSLAPGLAQDFIRQKRRLVKIAHQISQGCDIVWEIATTARPDCYERYGI